MFKKKCKQLSFNLTKVMETLIVIKIEWLNLLKKFKAVLHFLKENVLLSCK